MDKLLSEILAQMRSAWRYRWWALLVSWLVAIGGWMYVLTMKNVYEAEARVYVDSESTLRPLLDGLTSNRPNAMGRVDRMMVEMLSRPNLEEVARNTDLDLRAKTESDMELLLDSLQHNIRISSAGGKLYLMQFTDTDREMAIRVVQTLLNDFVENTLGENRTDQNQAHLFLKQQIADYEARLRESEKRLADFKKSNVGFMPDSRGDYFSRLQLAQGDLSKYRAQLGFAITRRDELRKQISGEEPVFGIASPTGQSGGVSSYDARIAQHEAALDAMLLRYTERHPDVIAIKETIGQLEERRQTELESRGSAGGPAPGLMENPVYQRMRIGLSEAEVEIASLERRVANQRKIVTDIQRLVDTVPEVEAELQSLNRDYQVTNANYQNLLARLEGANLSEEADKTSEQLKFRIIDPPNAPLDPSAPNRPLMMLVVLAGALGAGGGLAFLLSQSNPVFSDRDKLRRVTGLPVLGAVDLVWTEAQRKRSTLIGTSFVAGIAGLGMVFGAFVYFEKAGAAWIQSILA